MYGVLFGKGCPVKAKNPYRVADLGKLGNYPDLS